MTDRLTRVLALTALVLGLLAVVVGVIAYTRVAQLEERLDVITAALGATSTAPDAPLRSPRPELDTGE